MRLGESVLKYQELEKHLKNAVSGAKGEKFAAVYVISGEDEYLCAKAVKQFRTLIDNEFADFNFLNVTASDGIFSALDALNTFPMFDVRKVVVSSDFGEKLTDGDNISLDNYLKKPSLEAILVAVASGEVAKALKCKANTAYVDCAKLDGDALYLEMDKMLAAAPLRLMEIAAKRELALNTLSCLARISCEIVKLKAYTENCVSNEITLSDVRELVSPDTDYQIYSLSNAVSEKDGGKALMILDNFARNGIKSTTVISLMYGHYRKMLHVELHKNDTEQEIATLLGITTKAVYSIRRVSSNYSQVRLKNSVDYLHNLQYDILSGRRAENSALPEAVLTLLTI